MNDSMERALEAWMREAGTVEADDVHHLVRSLPLPGRGRARSHFLSFAKMAAVLVISLGIGAYTLITLPPMRTGDVAPGALTPSLEPTPVAAVPTPSPAAARPTPTPSSSAPVWLPPWADDDVPEAVARRTALPFCGVERHQGPSRDAFMDPAIRSCFLAALRGGRAAEFGRIQATTEGDPVATIYRHEPGIGILVLIDSTQDAYGTPVWTRMRCGQWVEEPAVLFRPIACEAASVVGGTPSPGPSDVAQDGTEGLVADLQAAGALTRELLVFEPTVWPPSAQASLVCVGDELISVYVFEDARRREETAGRIDRVDPTDVDESTHIDWTGAPRFWQRDRILVLYVGGDETTEATLTSIMGQPFARGPGRPAPRDERC